MDLEWSDYNAEGNMLIWSGDDRITLCCSGSRYDGIQPISSRLMTLRLEPHPDNVTIFQCYGPISDCDEEEVEKFYRNTEKELAAVRHFNCTR